MASKQRPISPLEAVRVARLHSVVMSIFGDAGKADLWLHRSLKELGGESPLACARTEAGARVVETILGKIAWGAGA